MKEKANYQPLFLVALLFLLGTISPSNGVDDRVNKTPLDLITTALIIGLGSLAVFLIWIWIEKQWKAVKN